MTRSDTTTNPSPEDPAELWAELDALLAEPDKPAPAPARAPLGDQPRWLRNLVSGERTATTDVDTLLDIAGEYDPRGIEATITGLLEALRLRHIDDDTTGAIVAALQYLHLPALLDLNRGE